MRVSECTYVGVFSPFGFLCSATFLTSFDEAPQQRETAKRHKLFGIELTGAQLAPTKYCERHRIIWPSLSSARA